MSDLVHADPIEVETPTIDPDMVQEQPTETPEETPTETPEETPTPTPVHPTIDTAAFAKEFGTVIADAMKSTVPVAPQMSAEEAKKLLNIWEPTKEWQTKFDNLETREAALTEMRDGFQKQVDTISMARLQEMQSQIDARYAPLLQHIQQQETQAREARFNTRYPDLANPKLRPIINGVMQQLIAQKASFKNENEAFVALATNVEAAIKIYAPDFKLKGAAAPAKSSGSTIPVTTPGAGGGAGGGVKAKSTGNRVLDVLGPVGSD